MGNQDCFFVVDAPWWNEDIPHLNMPILPTREVHNQKLDVKGLMMIYADQPFLSFWSQFLRKGYEKRAEIDGDQGLSLAFSRFMGIDPKQVVSYGIRHWRTELCGVAWHLWTQGVKSSKIQEKVTAFSLERNGNAKLHICGEAFSDYLGFIDGALPKAREVMGKITAT